MVKDLKETKPLICFGLRYVVYEWNKTAQPKTDKWLNSPSHFLLCVFTIWLLFVVLLPDNGDYPQNLHVEFCPNK